MDASPASTDTTVNPYRPGEAETRLQGPWLVLAWIVCSALVVLTFSVFVASIPAYVAQLQTMGVGAATCTSEYPILDTTGTLHNLGLSPASYTILSVALIVTSTVGWFAVGGVIAWHKSTNWMALLVAIMLITEGVVGTSCLTSPLEKSSMAWRLPIHFLDFLGPVFFLLVFSLFPNGQFVPRWTRWLVIVLSVAYAPPAFFPDLPFSGLFSKLFVLGASAFLVIVQLYRYRHVSNPIQRQQTRWVVFPLAMGLVVFVGWYIPAMIFSFPGLSASRSSLVGHPVSIFLTLLVPPGNPIFAICTLLIPLSLGIAILRSQLWNIDVIISRTLIYGTLTTSIVCIYALVVGLLGILLQMQGNTIISLLAIGLIAVLFQPLRDRLQRGVNRLIYGERDDPYRVLSRLGQRLEATLTPDAVLPTIVETVAQALKLPYAAIMLKQGDEFTIAASYGASQDTPLHLPLVYHTEMVGELLLVPHMPGESFTAADRRLLDDLARQAGIAVRKLLRHDPGAAEALLADATTQAQMAITDIRRVVYALRPPSLDDLGLVAALREQTAQYRASGVSLSLDAPDPLPLLPAAVEVACYRIVQEALTNVMRHAHARTCAIHLSLDETFSIEITDDGIGLPQTYRSGVGLTSMRERATELGGTYCIEAMAGGGTRVHAQLPLS